MVGWLFIWLVLWFILLLLLVDVIVIDLSNFVSYLSCCLYFCFVVFTFVDDDVHDKDDNHNIDDETRVDLICILFIRMCPGFRYQVL